MQKRVEKMTNELPLSSACECYSFPECVVKLINWLDSLTLEPNYGSITRSCNRINRLIVP